MNALIATLMMLGPWASGIDVIDVRDAYAVAIDDCGLTIREGVSAIIDLDKPDRDNFSHLRIEGHKYGICLKGAAHLRFNDINLLGVSDVAIRTSVK